MPDPFVVLLDQNIPRAITSWLPLLRQTWIIHHAAEVGLSGEHDEHIYRWAQEQQALVMTFDEDFADQRTFPVGSHGFTPSILCPILDFRTRKLLACPGKFERRHA